jgi:IPT/TIG domain/FG-GAP repeat
MVAQCSYVDTTERLPVRRPEASNRRPVRTWLAILGVVLAALAVLARVAAPLAPSLRPGIRGKVAVRASIRTHRSSARTQLAVPLAAEGPISAALGGDEAAYRVSGLHASNRAQRMQLRFSPHGVTLSSGPTRLSLALQGVGRGNALHRPGMADPLAISNRVSYARGTLREWYVNGPLGLEQGFDLAKRPAGSGALTLAIAVSGAAHIRLRNGGALLSGPGGTLRYGGLSASDVRGHRLRAWLGLSAGRLLIHVEDRGARYPVRIDPFVQQGEPLTADDEVGEGAFGYSVALSADGNTALIGGPGDHGSQGAAWVFTRSGQTWTQQGGKLTPREEQGEGGFGSSVALSADGNTALIGGATDDNGLGAAWVFIRSGEEWTQQAKLTGGEASGLGLVGASVALSADGNTALVGNPGGRGGAGAAWVFTRSDELWTQAGTPLVGQGEVGEGEAGAAVALSSNGGTALIGGPGDNRRQGAAWVFTHPGGIWTQQGTKLTSRDTGPSELGASAALSASGDTALLGAPDDFGGAGSAVAFVRAGGEWQQQGSPLTVNRSGSEHFGSSVALSSDGNTALLSGVGLSGIWKFKHEGEEWPESESVATGGSGAIALSADSDTLLVGGGATNHNVGVVDVLVEVPEVSSIQPVAGPASGGTQVTIHGRGFEGVSAVTFGANPAASFTVNSSTEITAVSPPASAGSVNVKVATAAGNSPAQGVAFTYGIPPAAPTHIHAKAGEGQATVTFEPPEGASEEDRSYTVTASPGGAQETGFVREITMRGLANGVKYTFTVSATDQFGTSPPSAPSNAVVPGRIVLGAAKRLSDGAVVLDLEVPGSGVLSASQATASAAKAGSGHSKHATPTLIEPSTQTVNGAGTEVLVLKPTSAALRQLAGKRAISTTAAIVFTPTAGPASGTDANLGFTRPGFSFESKSELWVSAWGGAKVTWSGRHRHSGEHALAITLHSSAHTAVDVTEPQYEGTYTLNLLQPGVPISVWVYRPASTRRVGVWAIVRVGESWTECRGAEVRPRANRWVEVTVTVPSSLKRCVNPGPASNLTVHGVGVEIDDEGLAARGQSLYVDDVSW